MLTSKKKFLSCTINILFIILVISCWFFESSNSPYNIYFTMNALSFMSFVIFLITNPYRILSSYTFIFLFIYLYNCGQLWMDLFGIEILSGSFVITRFSYTILAESVFYFVLFTALFHFFGIIFSQSIPYKDNINFDLMESLNNDEIILFKKLLYILLFISLPLLTVYDVGQVILARTSGYAAALYARSDSTILAIFSTMFALLIFGIVICEKNTKKRKIVALYGVARYVIMMVLVGYRMQAMAFLCSLFIVWTLRDDEKKLKHKGVIVIILGVILLIVASLVSQYRSGGVNNFSSISDSLIKSVREIGGSFIDIPILMEKIDIIGFAYGRTYTYGLINMVPFLIRIFPNATTYLTLSATLNDNFIIYSSSSLGGNLYAELFYNFGWYALFATPLLAYIVFFLNKRIDEKGTLIAKTMEMYLFFILALYIRGNMGEITVFLRNILYVLILYKLLKSRQRN
ncbi:oligosaccharide repeat unit polymerase [Clostridium cadaveris]|uniref:Oligosaccharide repeat unit polymerase n=1 Tax=Clostridium cadaveris TaxID=1529 RepID=A0A1I2N822_9CLOT|nr:O-antigen polysaccharide polymerase Wzy [Clostridium cadaveris]MDM8313012.1 O-antigen polysaccharide polymerase Wzy [Clostridium cadaveris]SFF99009.1 oligosaccharide repeat unit polymerase [Clostridium cadaveris]